MFTNRTVNGFDSIINTMTAQMLQRWEQQPADTIVWLDREMGHIAFQIVFEFYSARISIIVRTIWIEILKVINTNSQTLRAMLRLFPWLPVRRQSRHPPRKKKQLDQIVLKLIEQRRKQGVGDNDMLDRLLAVRDEKRAGA